MSVSVLPPVEVTVAGTICGTVLISRGQAHYGLLIVGGAYVLSYLETRITGE